MQPPIFNSRDTYRSLYANHNQKKSDITEDMSIEDVAEIVSEHFIAAVRKQFGTYKDSSVNNEEVAKG